MSSNFLKVINGFSKMKALVIGEPMLDIYLKGEAREICREAPVPKVAIKAKEYFAGGASNTAVNIASLGAKVKFLSVLGDDPEGQKLCSILNNIGVDIKDIYVDHGRRTITKKRIFAENQLLLRIDDGATNPIRRQAEKELISKLLDLYKEMDLVIISDYGYGILTEKIKNTIARLQQIHQKVLIIDSKHLNLYQKVKSTVIKPNFSEAVILLGITKPEIGPKRIDQLIEYRQDLLFLTKADYVAVTCDKDGGVIFGRDNSIYRTFSKPVENIKAAGAGDTYAAVLGLSFAITGKIWWSSEIASKAAGVIIQKEGTAFCTNEELSEVLSAGDKLVESREKLGKLIKSYKEKGKTIVFTNGCFDILHSGHIEYLSQAKKMGDILVVGVNTDSSVRKLKGAKRPINPLSERMRVLAGLSSVDHLISFTESTPVKLVNITKPNIFVKGGDYTLESLPEAGLVSELGGKIEILPFVSDRSTTKTISKITHLFNKDEL